MCHLTPALMAPPDDHPLVAGENAAADLFADPLFGQGGEGTEAHQCRHKHPPKSGAFGGAWPTKRTTSISATVPVRGVKVVSPHRPDDQRATIYDSSHVWTNCTGADRVLMRQRTLAR